MRTAGRAICISFCLAATGCETQEGVSARSESEQRAVILSAKPISISASELQRYENTVAKRFRDPSSVQFDAIRVLQRSDGTKVICGRVNGKNGFGSYVGFKPFVATIDPGGYVDGPLIANIGNSVVQQKARRHASAAPRPRPVPPLNAIGMMCP